jgi:signal transduction histidine kinase
VITAIINTEENEKKRFAKELHDGLGPLLSSVKMSLSALGKSYGTKRKEILGSVNAMTNEAISAIREISNNLSPHVLTNFGVASAISSFVTKINQSKTMVIDFHSKYGKGEDRPRPGGGYISGCCELINNSIRHSGASHIDIDL